MARHIKIERESTLTDRYQTTIPEAVREALHLKKRDKVHYTVQADGKVILSKGGNEEDPILSNFLNFLANDMKQNPQKLAPLSEELFNQIKNIIKDVKIDLNEKLDDEND